MLSCWPVRPNPTASMRYRYRVLGFLFCLSIITYLDRVCISVVGPRMKKDLDLTNEQFGYVLSAFALAYALFEVPTGVLGDRIGPRRVLTRVVTWWSAFTVLTGTAASLTYLVVIRFLFGIGEAGAYPNASIVISRWFPAVETGRAQSFIWAAGRIGGALSPLIVVPVAAAFGWRASFWVMGGIGLIWALAWYGWFRDFPRDQPGVSTEERDHIEATRSFKMHSHSIPWRAILRNRNMWAIMLMFHFYMYGAYFFTGWLPTYLQDGRQFSEDQMKLFATLPFMLGAIGCFTGGYASDYIARRYGLKTGRRAVGIVGMGMSSVVMLAAALATNNQTAALLLALGMAFKDLTLPVSFAVCVDIGRSKSGTVSGAMNMAGQLGAFFLGILFGKIVDATGNYNLPLFLIAFLLLCSSLLWLVIDPTKEIVLAEDTDEAKLTTV
ncbi:Inner membrane transport protein yjjL [Fibrisoma limi BUZ 3]|uniref:Inner membrane transport protein yjjL n=2 Tax=Fibrisoma limi TaxID=663275 RepID=I2GB43_9BACT|nr:Inner membrane transport protein yjjL [Fibrisoma limi BUZ 3]